MDSDVIQAFNKALVSMQETKGGLVSKQKVLEITKAAMNAVRYFKHVVFIIERYLAKCRQEFKMPALYVMDSILRQAKKQYKHKDVFAPRFAINLSNTIQNVLTCDSSDRLKVVRVVNLWQAHQIFIEDALDPVLQHCRASGLEVDPTRVEQLVKGDKADMLLYQPQFAERGASFGSSGGSLVGSGGTSLIVSKLEMPPIPIIPCERRTPQQQQPRVVPPPPPGPPPATTTPTSTPIGGIGIQHQPSLEERLSQFKKLTTPPATGVSSRANSVSGGTPTAMMSTSTNTLETGPKTPPTLEDQDHRIATGQFVQQSASSISIDSTSGLSSTDVLQLLLNGAGLVVPPDIGARPDLLAKVQRFMNERVGESLEIERRREGNIKNLLAREFDYSDEEDEAAAVAAALNSSQSLQSLGPLAGVSREKLLTVARTLFGDAAFQQELRQQFIVQHHQLQHHQQSHVSSSTLPSFQLPDFSLPPPNIVGAAAINGGGMLPKLFMSPPPKLVGSTPLPPGTSPSASAVGFNLAGVPPPSLMSISTSVPSSSSGNNRDRSPPSPSSGKRHHHRDRERERDRDKNRDNFAGAGNGGSGGGRRRSDRNNDRTSLAQSGGRKRNREWTPAGDDKDLRRSSVSPPGTKRERNGDDGVAGRRGDRQTKRSSGRRGERSGRHDEEERERDRDRDKERDQRERERRRIGLPSKTKSDHVLIASRTLWFGRIPSGATESDIVDSVKDIGIPEKVSLVFGRGCAYVTMPDRRLAFKILDRLATKNIRVQNKNVKVDWATIPYVKDNLQLMDIYWDLEQGYAQIPFSKLPDGSVDSLMDGAWLELDTLPSHLKDRYTNTGLKFMEQQQQQQNLLLSTSAAINAQFAHHHHQQQQQHLLQQAAATPSTTTPLVTVTLPQAVMPSVATAAAGLVPAAMFTQAAAAAAAAQMAFAGNLLPFSFPPPNIPPPAIGGGGTTSTVQQQQQQQQAGTGTTTVMQQRQTQPPSGNAVIGSLLSAPASTLASIAGFANVGFAGGGFPPGGFGAAGGGGGGGGQSAGGGRGGGNWAPRGRGGGRGVGGGGGFQQRFNSPGGGTFRPGSGGGSFQMGGNFGGGRGRGSGGGGGGFRGGGRGRGWDGANQQQGGRGGGGRGFGGARGGRGGGPFFAGERMPFREFSGGGEGFGSGANREPFGFGALPPQSESEGNVPAAMPSNNGSSFGGTSGPSQKNEADFKPSGAASSDSFSNTAFGNVTTPTTLKIEPNRFNAPPHPEPFSSDSAPFCAKTEPKMNMFGQQQHQHCSETESDAPPGLD